MLVSMVFVSALVAGCVSDGVLAPVVGTIYVDVTPDGIAADWTLTGPDGLGREGQGDLVLEGQQAGDYVMRWGSVEGYSTPSTVSFSLARKQSLRVEGAYIAKSRPVGEIVLDPAPDWLQAPWTLVSADAQVHSGEGERKLTQLPVGDYVLTWGDVPGFSTPRTRTVTLTAGAELVLEDTYRPDEVNWAPRLPAENEWTDHGEILGPGEQGDWDLYLWGGFAASPVKHRGTYLLYYQGSDGYDEGEATVTHRAIGVATSSDGIHFEKYGNAPVLTWLPTSGLEEGAASGGAWTDPQGTVHFFYGANTAISSSEVNADARVATSVDGLSFADGGLVLDHADRGVWGHGDELFPIIGFREGSNWFTCYIPNGTAQKGLLGIAWGPSPIQLDRTAQVSASGSPVRAWGPGGFAKLSPTSYAIFVSAPADAHLSDKHVDVYTMNPASPSSWSGPVRTYAFANMVQATVLLDREVGKWFLYYRSTNASSYGVRTAPVVFDQ